jgi:hypothetical protein
MSTVLKSSTYHTIQKYRSVDKNYRTYYSRDKNGREKSIFTAELPEKQLSIGNKSLGCFTY